LINKNSTFDEITEIHSFIKSRKSVPIRYMITVFHLVYYSNRPIGGYFPLIQKEQTATEDVVRSLWPIDRVGTEKISIVYYFPKPSWKFLGKIIESLHKESNDNILRPLRSSLALLEDSDEPLRATMSDPVRNQVEKGNYITEKFKEKVWATIKYLLSTSDCINYSNKDLYQMWMDLG
jgi:hypothetical protein